MKRYLTIAVIALGLFWPSVAFGLDCMEPRLDGTVIGDALMIFEGVAGPERSLDSREEKAARRYFSKMLDDGTQSLRVYNFTVTRGWKGTVAGRRIDVVLDTYWGDHFDEGEVYLVVNPQRIGDLFVLPLCGDTVDLKYAADHGFLTTLEQVIGSGK